MPGKRVVTPGGLPPRSRVLGLFVVLNITLYASDYFTGDGINDAVLYT
ncbi:phosphoglycerol transferase I [Klebsiella aerogenes]|nr:phosphoglycerol transferase I [Klebsiella aerogenes]